jgi:hypothetical protein
MCRNCVMPMNEIWTLKCAGVTEHLRVCTNSAAVRGSRWKQFYTPGRWRLFFDMRFLISATQSRIKVVTFWIPSRDNHSEVLCDRKYRETHRREHHSNLSLSLIERRSPEIHSHRLNSVPYRMAPNCQSTESATRLKEHLSVIQRARMRSLFWLLASSPYHRNTLILSVLRTRNVVERVGSSSRASSL